MASRTVVALINCLKTCEAYFAKLVMNLILDSTIESN